MNDNENLAKAIALVMRRGDELSAGGEPKDFPLCCFMQRVLRVNSKVCKRKTG